MLNQTILSIHTLHFVLLVASAFVAAITPKPSKPNQANTANNGRVCQFSCDNAAQTVVTCAPTEESPLDCHLTDPYLTTGPGLGTRTQSAGGTSMTQMAILQTAIPLIQLKQPAN